MTIQELFNLGVRADKCVARTVSDPVDPHWGVFWIVGEDQEFKLKEFDDDDPLSCGHFIAKLREIESEQDS